MSDIVKDAKALGYVETLLHRRRYIPDITSRNFNLRGFAERTAMNTPIQAVLQISLNWQWLNLLKNERDNISS